jgi:hypothetical protein
MYVVIRVVTIIFFVLCFFDRDSGYNCVNKNQLDAQRIHSTFRQPLHVSGPSSGGTTVCLQQLVLIIILDDCLLSWLDWKLCINLVFLYTIV